MSAPKTNIEKQKRRHRVPLIGIAASIAAVIVFAIVIWSRTSENADDVPQPAVNDPPAAATAPAE